MLDALANEALQGWLVPLLGRTGDRRAMEPLRELVESGTCCEFTSASHL